MHDFLLASIGGCLIGVAAILLMLVQGSVMGISGILSSARAGTGPVRQSISNHDDSKQLVTLSWRFYRGSRYGAWQRMYFRAWCLRPGANFTAFYRGHCGFLGLRDADGVRYSTADSRRPLMRLLGVFFAGLLFGLGLTISDMINPDRVLSFLDVTGDWDASLLFVMAGAVLVTAMGYALVLRRDSPLLAADFKLPTRRDIDFSLLAGASLFGLGWGLVGLCPGPAIALLLLEFQNAMWFLISMPQKSKY